MKLRLRVDNDGSTRDGNEFDYRFVVDNYNQLGWIIEQIIKILNSEEVQKIKSPRSKNKPL
jgi:hypothetical protein